MKMHALLKKVKKITFENKGLSYMEFLLMLMILVSMIYIFVQIYGVISTQILVSDTAKNLLRHIELAGGAVYPGSVVGSTVDVLNDAKNELNSANNIDRNSVTVLLNRPANVNDLVDMSTVDPSTFKYQIRTPIKLVLATKYNFFQLNGLTNSTLLSGGITISSSFQGASEKFFKDPNYIPINSQH